MRHLDLLLSASIRNSILLLCEECREGPASPNTKEKQKEGLHKQEIGLIKSQLPLLFLHTMAKSVSLVPSASPLQSSYRTLQKKRMPCNHRFKAADIKVYLVRNRSKTKCTTEIIAWKQFSQQICKGQQPVAPHLWVLQNLHANLPWARYDHFYIYQSPTNVRAAPTLAQSVYQVKS